MYKIQTLNKISAVGLNRLPRDTYEVASEMTSPDGIILRSFKMHDMELPTTLKAIARAGAGTNNIPVERCTEAGIVVFNTPGANANAVKELALTALFISSRKIVDGIIWAKSLAGKGDEVPKEVETGKSQFIGPEIQGKTLGIIGLGAIGVMLANAATALGMNVVGYDPFLSVNAALNLDSKVQHAQALETLLKEADYISVHVPFNDATRNLINAEKLHLMKDGVRIINLSRGGLVNNADVKEAIKSGKVAAYATDFPDEELVMTEGVIPLPHLGASTPEAEDNCATMAANQLKDFLENGNIINSVNFPTVSLERTPNTSRLIVANKDVPNMVGQVTAILADAKINIAEMVNKHRNNIGYNIIDVESTISEETLNTIKAIDGVIMAAAL